MAGEKILIIEDELLIADEIAACLEQMGYAVCGPVPSGEEGIRLAVQERPDLVITDIRLGEGMDGIRAAAEIRDRLDLPVVYLTAHADEVTLQRAEVTEPYGYVMKPFSELELRAAVRLALYKAKSENIDAAGGAEPDGEGNSAGVQAKCSAPSRKVLEYLRAVPGLDSCRPDTLELLAQGCRFESVRTGQILICEGESESPGFTVVSGRVSLVKGSATGREVIVELLCPHDLFGLAVSLAWQPYPVTAKAQTSSEILWVPKFSVEAAAAYDSTFSRRIVTEVFGRLRDAYNLTRGLAHDRVSIRVAAALLALAPRLSTGNISGKSYEIVITRQELADCIGSVTETVVRTTRTFEKEKVLDLSKRGRILVLDADRLRKIASGES